MSTAHYILQVNIYLIVFYGFYKLLLDKETYFILNRIYLLSAALLSLAIPFLRIEWFTKQAVAEPVYAGVDQLNNLMTQMIITPGQADRFSMGDIIVVIYLAGILFFAGKLIWQLFAVSRLLKRIRTGTAFSFFNRKAIDAGLPGLQTIHKHEEIHMRQLHSLDVLFFELLGLFTWFNPAIYGYKNAVKNIHEYLADEAAAAFQGDKKEYALLLLSNAFGVQTSTLTNRFFNKSLIKKRIFMLHKQRSKRTAALKYGLFVPLFAITLIMSSATIRNNEKIQEIADEIPLNHPATVVNEVVANTVQLAMNADPVKKMVSAGRTEITPDINKQKMQMDPGWDRFYNFVKMFARYPASAQQNNIQGTSMLKFTIAAGSIENVGVAAKLGGGCDAEAMRVIISYPGYAGLKDGNYTLKIKYLLSGVNTPKKNEQIEPVKGYTALNDIVIVAYGGGPETESGDNKVYDFLSIETQPSFSGGMQNFYEYLKKTIKYPEEAKKNNVEGKVFLSFIVEKNGDLTDIKVERRVGSGTDEEAVRVIKQSPKWTPGTQNGKPVRVKYNLPVSFSLGKSGSSKPGTESTGNFGGISFKDSNGATMKFSGNPSNQPLVIIDGTITDQASMLAISPGDIDAISVIKDASATAIYGAKAANGVIIVTTKAGKNGKKPANDKKTTE